MVKEQSLRAQKIFAISYMTFVLRRRVVTNVLVTQRFNSLKVWSTMRMQKSDGLNGIDEGRNVFWSREKCDLWLKATRSWRVGETVGLKHTSSHLYQPHGHVITGDLSIIPNSKLRDLIAKSPKYREPCKVDWDKNLSLLCEAVDQYALQWTKWEMVELSVVSSSKEMVKGQIKERISKLKQNFKQPTGKVLQNADVKACLLPWVRTFELTRVKTEESRLWGLAHQIQFCQSLT